MAKKPNRAGSPMTINGHPVLDYPLQGEKISAGQYSVRVAAPGAKAVEVAIDQGDWRACREAVGYWWFDWSGYEAGEHEVVARVRTPEGRVARSEPHEFFVAFENLPKPSNS